MSVWSDMLRGLDPERQLPAVLETRSAVVSAGAGSGKTRVLAVRYLHLVKERGIPPERILCLTFTKKAAAEMSERIRGMLAACAVDDDDFLRALEAFPSSRVSTLDSFCAEVARCGCPRWGVAPDFSVDKQPEQDLLSALAIEFLLKRRKDPIAASFMAASGFEQAVTALISLASGREGLIATDRNFDIESQDAQLMSMLVDLHARLYEQLIAGISLEPGTGKGALAWRDISADFPSTPPTVSSRDELELALKDYRSITSLRVATGNSAGAQYYNTAGKLAKPLATMALLAVQALLDERRAASLSLLYDFVVEAAEARASSATLSFSDVSAIALKTLETDTVLRDWYTSRYDAIMVDEFQDDNDLQKRILYCLAERRKGRTEETGSDTHTKVGVANLEPGVLFFVGDEKQSIYAFRGADVTVFRGLSSELSGAPGGLGMHSLDINWRSEPGLIDFFNRTFSAVLPSPDDPFAKDYEARFAGLEAGPATEGVEPSVVYLESNEPDDDSMLSSGEAESWRIAELVRSLVGDGTIISAKGPDGGKVARACRYDDIAILFKSTASQNIVERYFRLLGIPYTASSTSGLFTESILGDIYAMLRLAVYPDDRMAFASVMRGPLARLSDDSLFAALSPGATGPDGLMGLDPSILTEDDRSRFIAVLDSWNGVKSLADREPLRRIIEYLWYERGLRWNVLKDPNASSFLEHFDYAWSLAVAADSRAERLVDLVAALEPRMGELDRFDETVLRESSRGVSIMTVHMSKGLEFPVVILPDVESKSRLDTRSPIASAGPLGPSVRLLNQDGEPFDPVAELLLAKKKFDRDEGEDAMDESIAETARLFYVACTRAICRLYMIGKVPRNADSKGLSFRSLFLRAWPWAGPLNQGDDDFISERPEDAPGVLSVQYVPARSRAEAAHLADSAGKSGADRARSCAAAPSRAVNERKARWSVTGAAAHLEKARQNIDTEAIRRQDIAIQSESDPHESEPIAPSLSEAEFGTLCHQLIEARLTRPGTEPEAWGTTLRLLERLPVSIASRQRAEALNLADSFLASPRGIAAASARDKKTDAGSIFEIEYPFVWRQGSKPDTGSSLPIVLSGSIDLLYGDDDGMVVVDFKTDKHAIPERHAFQLSVYRESAESIFGIPTRAYIHYLRSGTEYEITVSPDISALGMTQICPVAPKTQLNA